MLYIEKNHDMKNPILAFTLVANLLTCNASQATGTINFIEGNVTINNYKNEMRVPQPNEKVNVGDTIITGKDGEVHIITDDKGIIAIRPQTQLQIDTYQAEGRDDDAIVLKLLRGSFRSITGWIGKNHPNSYQVRTPTATITMAATDHETLVIENGADAGTYDKVNTGEALLDTTFGKTEISAHKAGFVPKSAEEAPKILADIPRVFQLSTNVEGHEQRIDDKKDELSKQQTDDLQQKQQDNLKKGGGTSISGAVGKPKIGDMEDERKATMALEELFRYYEAGNVNFIRNRLDHSMIGFQKLLDGISTETNQCKQMRIRLYDTQVQAGPDLAVIQTNWEKRCLMLPNFAPRVDSGFTTFLMHKEKTGWGMAALSNDNPFVSAGRNATITITSSTSCLAIYGTTGVTPLPFNITLNDPDLAGASTTSVTLATTQGDSESITLNATGGGTFTRNTLPINKAAPAGNDGVVEIVPVIVPAAFLVVNCPTVTVRYNDSTTSNGLPLTVQSTTTIP
jgi:uncharacterized lipoprotein YehR (DUF1307 family)